MGERGARLTAEATARAEALVGEWAPLGAVRSKKMFGGHGVFLEDTMFAIVDSTGQVFLRADEETVPDFEAAGSAKHGRMPYWSVPDPVLTDEAMLRDWAGRAVLAARRA